MTTDPDGRGRHGSEIYRAEQTVEAALNNISVANGYRTDIIGGVHYGRTEFSSKDSYPILSYHIIAGTVDDPGDGRPFQETVTLVVEAHLQGREDASLRLDKLRSDIVEAIKCMDSAAGPAARKDRVVSSIRYLDWGRIDRRLGSKYFSIDLTFSLTIPRCISCEPM